MRFSAHSRLFRLIATLVAASTAGGPLGAATVPATEMSPYRVEAEFGVDGLRIQNSQSVFNAHLLEQHGIVQMQDIAGVAPNLFISNSDSRGFGDVLALRGNANSLFFSPPSVALYVDDVPSGSVSSYPSTLLNIESFVVKAGPHGTDYGRNAPAGVIDIKTRAPGTQHQGRIVADFGSYQARGVQMAFDGPVSDRIGYSASLGYSEREGYIDNTFLRGTADDRESFAARGALHVKIDETLTFRVGGLFEKSDDQATRLTSLFSPDRYSVSSDLRGSTEIDRQQLSFHARKRLAGGTLVATTSWQNWELDPSLTDLDLSPMPAAFSRVVQSEQLWTQDVRFESTPTAEKAQWRAGLFLFDSASEGNALRQFMPPPASSLPLNYVQTERTIYDIDQRNLALYANADHPLSSATLVKAGVRLERAFSEIDRTKISSNNLGIALPQDTPLSRDQNSDYFSANLGVVHTVSDSLSVLVRTSLALKPEGYSAFTGNPLLARFDAERIWANEVGVTFSPPNSRFGGSLLGFWNRSNDYQFERTVPNSTDFVVVNANEVIARGFEAKFMWNPVERLWWDFQAGYIDAKFEEHSDASGARVNDNHVPFIPRYTLRTGFTVDLGQGFSANASYAVTGRTFYDERNTAMFSQKSHGIVNAQLRYRFDRWAVTLYGHNLLEEEYYQFINPEIFAGSPGTPRRFGVQLSFTY
jgi:iron complex outermembrane recepter protein